MKTNRQAAEVVEDFKGDLWGQVLTTQQRVEALAARLGALERRISADAGAGDGNWPAALSASDGDLEELRTRLAHLETAAAAPELCRELKDVREELVGLRREMEAASKPTSSPLFQWATYRVGELSGLVAGGSALTAAALLATGHLDALKSPAFSLVVGVALVTVAGVSWRRRRRDEKMDVIYIP